MNPDHERLLGDLRRNHGLMLRSLDGFTHDSSLVRAGDGGSNANWLVGHLVDNRDNMLRQLGAETTWDRDHGRRYARGSRLPEGDDIEPLDSLAAALEQSQARLEAALEAASPEHLAERSGIGERNRLSAVEFLAWHETYHLGQLAVYRRLVGLDGVIG